ISFMPFALWGGNIHSFNLNSNTLIFDLLTYACITPLNAKLLTTVIPNPYQVDICFFFDKPFI
ncbi:hypothetical protein ACQ1ZX_14760, partial [Enterococcus faecalis]|uniref:hypothetical protein n=1 Tax=Enterococcus faecalis TaxID=1351 RepID=UPI003D6AA3A0